MNVFRVSLERFERLQKDHMLHAPGTWGTRSDAVGKEGVKSEVKYWYLSTSLGLYQVRRIEDKSQMGVETLCQYFLKLIVDLNIMYKGSILNRRTNHSDRGANEQAYEDAGFTRCMGSVDFIELI